MAYKRSSVLVGLPDQDRGWEQVQAKTFTKWLNTKLESRQIPPMRSLATDLSDGVKLVQLMEIMGDTSLGRFYMNPRMRVQKAENVNLALEFIKSRGVVLTNVGAEDIVDGNLKLILGMIWTLILRFTIADITEEGLTAKEGLLLWCQRKTAPYQDVDVTNFTTSFNDGLALCALIHRHRPDLLNYHALPKNDPHACTRTAFQVAEQHLGIPQLLDVEDLCDRPKPDERSVMTYVAQYFHAFSSMEQAQVVSRRVATFADVMQGAWLMQQDYESRARQLVDTMNALQAGWTAATFAGTYADARAQLTQFNDYKIGVKRELVRERTDLAALLGNIQTKLKTYHLPQWIPQQGLRQTDLDAAWSTLALAEASRSRSINAEIRNAKENLRIKFAGAANEFERHLREVAGGIGMLQGDLEAQLQVVKHLLAQLDPIKERLTLITSLEQQCTDAKVEENDHTIFTVSDLAFEWELVRASVSKKLAFIENQIVSRQHTNLTPAQLEEFESTFRYFDKDASNTLTVPELGAALASLGIIYTEDDIEQIHLQLCETFGAVSYDAFLTFLREITEDTTSPDQLLEAFQGLAGDKPYVTELDLRLALLPQGSIDYLKAAMPQVRAEGVQDAVYDYEGYLTGLFGVSQPYDNASTDSAMERTQARISHQSIPSVLEGAEATTVTTSLAASGPPFTSALAAGALSGLAVDLLFFPIDTIKTRLQSAQGFWAAGGFSGIYRGLASTAVGSAPGAAVFFTTYESMKPALVRWMPAVFGSEGALGPAGVHMTSASIAEVAACLIRVPTEVIKSRQQTMTYGKGTTTFQAFKKVFQEAGIRGYYRGFGSTVGREIPFTCIQFPLYERLKLEMARSRAKSQTAPFDTGDGPRSVSDQELVRTLPTWQAGLAGSIAGAIAAGLTTPLDVVKTRIMLHTKQAAAGTPAASAAPAAVAAETLARGVNTNIIPTLLHIGRTEGIKTLFSGFLPRTMWIGLGGAVFLGSFDAGIKTLS